MAGTTRATRASRRRRPKLEVEAEGSASDAEEAAQEDGIAESDGDEASNYSDDGESDGEASDPDDGNESSAPPPSPAKTRSRSATGRRRRRSPPKYAEADSDDDDDDDHSSSGDEEGSPEGGGDSGRAGEEGGDGSTSIPNKSSSSMETGEGTQSKRQLDEDAEPDDDEGKRTRSRARTRGTSQLEELPVKNPSNRAEVAEDSDGERPEQAEEKSNKRRRRTPSEGERESKRAREGGEGIVVQEYVEVEAGGEGRPVDDERGDPPPSTLVTGGGEAHDNDRTEGASPDGTTGESQQSEKGDPLPSRTIEPPMAGEPTGGDEGRDLGAIAKGNVDPSEPDSSQNNIAEESAGGENGGDAAAQPPTSPLGEEERGQVEDGDSASGAYVVDECQQRAEGDPPLSEPPAGPSSPHADDNCAPSPSQIKSEGDGKVAVNAEDDGDATMTDVPKNDDGDAAIDSTPPLESPGNDETNFDATRAVMSRIVLEETNAQQSPDSHASMDVECPPSSEVPAGEPHATPEPAGLSVLIQYPQPTSGRPPPSAGQLKMALYLEASKAHRGRGPERGFAKYWEALERYVAVGSRGRIRPGARATLDSVEATVAGFLTTRRMKRLHNKLVLAIMQEALQTNLPSRCSSHIPAQWKAKVSRSLPVKLSEDDVQVDAGHSELKSALHEWNADFGHCSGAWTAAGGGIRSSETTFGTLADHTGCSQIDDAQNDDVLPSARLPGALEIEPLVRRRAASSGLIASDDAIWMLVVAAREHSASIIKKVVENEKEFGNGYAPSQPIHFRTSLACQHLAPKARGGEDGCAPSQESGSLKPPGRGATKVINSTALAHVLAENHSVASRLMSMYTAVRSDERRLSSHHPNLDDVNGMINASIQRAASRRRKASPDREIDLSPMASSARPKTTELGGSLPRSYQSRPLPQSLPVSKPPIPANRPQIANNPQHVVQRRESIPVPPPVAPQPHLARASLPAQSMQPLLAQVMNHSDHRRAAQHIQQQAVPVPNIDPLTKPGFLGMGNATLVSAPAQNSSSPTKTPSPPPKRGSKNLAAMMARPSPQQKPAEDEDAAASGNENGASADKGGAATQAPEHKAMEDIDVKEEKNDESKESKAAAAVPARGRGRGFGVKNLAAMRKRTSISEKES